MHSADVTIGLCYRETPEGVSAQNGQNAELGISEKIVPFGLPRIIRLKENVPNSITARFTANWFWKTNCFVVEVERSS